MVSVVLKRPGYRRVHRAALPDQRQIVGRFRVRHLKTTSVVTAELTRRIRELHPYEVPEIIVIAIKEGDASYLKWIAENVRPSPAARVP
jgi:hypothetical protein